MSSASNCPSARPVSIRNSVAEPTIDFLGTVRRGMADAGLKEQAAAAWMGIDSSYLSRALSRENHLPGELLGYYLPVDFWKAVVRDLAGQLGMHVDDADELDRSLADTLSVLGRLVGALQTRTRR
jgi:hypothetical protein